MTERQWGWVGATSTGTSHLRAGKGCDDSGACLEIKTQSEPLLVAVVSDGAGSAAFARFGARIAVSSLCRSIRAFANRGGGAQNVDLETVEEWLDDIRDRIEFASQQRSASRKMFAATLVACIAQRDLAVVIHVGDGACAVRLRDNQTWLVPSWPAQGEYASTTYFVTDDPKPRAILSQVAGEIEEVAVFTDGLERLALDFGSTTAFKPFFESMFRPLRRESTGRQKRLSMELRTFLDSPSVVERTDDDKTLILARRV